jgi:N4-gp56 family major capsid protein
MPDTTTWTYDISDGVLKNHALSGDLLKTAARKMVFVPFTQKVNSFGRKMGESVTLSYWKELDDPTSAQLEERTRIPIDKLEIGHRTITVKEWGRGVEYTNLMQELSKFDPKTGAQKKLTRQMERAMDKGAADGFNNAKLCFIPTSLTGGTWDTDGVASTEALVNVTVDHLAMIRDYMANDIHVPFYESNNYIGIFATKGLRGVKSDRRYEAWHMYLRKGDLIFHSEAGRCEQIRLVESTHEAALSNGVGSGSVLGEGVVFGDEPCSRIEIDFPHLRAMPNYQGDFGRVKAVVWYGIVAFDVTWNTANDQEAKVIRVTSS